jgi:membrane associated rhomboid family serine protease
MDPRAFQQHDPDDPRFDAEAQGRFDKRRVLRAFNLSLAFVFVLVLVHSAQGSFDARAFSVAPWSVRGLPGLLTAPLLHGSVAHIASNAVSLLILGTLAGSAYPKATPRALPLLWLGSGLGAWLLGDAGTYHLGASGLAYGLMFLVIALGVLRRDRAAIAAGMIAFLFYGGALLAVLPNEPGVSWQSHLGGALAGVLAALLFRRRDPELPRRKYSWEIEEEEAENAGGQPEPPPREVPPRANLAVPVLWRRPDGRLQRVILRFPRRDDGTGR